MRKKRPLDRNTDILRDTRLVVLASEDKYAVKQYFEFFKSRRIRFKILETTDCMSAPEHVFERLENYLAEFEIGPDDQLWFVSDTDHWTEPGHIANFTRVIKLCRDKGIRVAVSNPCFELWLLMHFADPPVDLQTCDQLGDSIRDVVGAYNKTKIYNLPIDDESVREAINRSKVHQSDAGEIPKQMETRVHLILEELIDMNLISIAD